MAKTNIRGISQARAWWRGKVKEYGPVFFARAPTPALVGKVAAPDPTKVSHAFSGVFTYGWRVYAFTDVVARDRFVAEYARACESEDPCP